MPSFNFSSEKIPGKEALEESLSQEEKNESLEKARAIAGGGSYEHIMDELRAEKLLEENTAYIQKTYEGRLKKENFEMKEKDWEMLTLIWLFDVGTFEHSIRTFELAEKMIKSPMAVPGGETVAVETLLLREGVSSEQFLRAALFHDVGKVIIPREILLDHRSDEDLAPVIFPEKHFHVEGDVEEKKAALRALYEKGLRPIDLAPLNILFPGGKGDEIMHKLEERGFSKMATERDVLQKHESESGRILNLEGCILESELAGHHHNYKREKTPYLMSVSMLRMSAETVGLGMADLIHMADVTDAIRSKRSYKESMSDMEVLYVIAHDAKNGKIDPFTAYVWVSNQYEAAREKKEEKGEGLVQYVDDFLKESQKAFKTGPPFVLAA
jgi:hypothetical protein